MVWANHQSEGNAWYFDFPKLRWFVSGSSLIAGHPFAIHATWPSWPLEEIFHAKVILQNPEVDESGEKTPCTDQVAKACFHHLEMTTLPVIGVIRKYVRNLLTSKYFIGMITIPSIWNLYEGQGLHGTRFRCFLIQFQVWAQVTLKKIRIQTAANNLLSGKKGRKQQLVWKSCWLSRKWANYHLSIRSCHNSTTNPLLDQMSTSRSSTLPRLDRVGLSSLCVRFFVSENLVTAWIWAWNHSLTKWMVYHDGWLAGMFIILYKDEEVDLSETTFPDFRSLQMILAT